MKDSGSSRMPTLGDLVIIDVWSGAAKPGDSGVIVELLWGLRSVPYFVVLSGGQTHRMMLSDFAPASPVQLTHN